jgi:NAD(P)-dependent dehydrogenase (short-subunit alcohol dehydrogenase family)
MKTVLITGGNSGIGRSTVKALAERNFQVIFLARNREKAEVVKREVIAATKNSSVDYILADLTSKKQVRDSAEAFKKSHPRLDVLINNAGVCLPERRITGDGMEESFQINHLSHFMLTNLLLDHLGKSHDARIINVSSAAYRAGSFDAENLQGEKRYSSFGIYANTKLYNILFTLELADRLRDCGIKVNALHPGVVGTNFAHEFGGIFKILYRLGKPFMISPEDGSVTSVYLASSDEVRKMTGKYFIKCKPVRLENSYLTRENRKLLWQKSLELADMNV